MRKDKYLKEKLQEKPSLLRHAKIASKYLAYVAVLLCLVLAVKNGIWVTRNLVCEVPLEVKENTMPLITDLILHGHNPYSLEFHPVFINQYGILYPWLVSPFALLFGNTLPVHRAVSCFFILATCALMLAILRRDKVPWTLAACGVGLLFVYLGRDLCSIARPDSLGLCLLLASLAVPLWRNFDPISLAASIAFGILGFMAKPYCLVGVPLLAAYIFLFESKAKGIIFGFCGIAGLLAAGWILNSCFECYFIDTVIILGNSATSDYPHLWRMLSRYSFIAAGWLSVLALAVGFPVWRQFRGPQGRDGHLPSSQWFHWGERNSPFLAFKVSLPAFVLVCNAAIILLKLGKHNGADLTYWQELLSPFLIWTALRFLSTGEKLRRWASVLVLPSVVIGFVFFWNTEIPSGMTEQWNQIKRLLAPCDRVFVSAPLSMIALEQGKKVYDAGQTEFNFLAYKGNPFSKASRYLAKCDEFQEDMRRKASRREFDIIIIPYRMSPILPPKEIEENYYLDAKFLWTMPCCSRLQEVYRPKCKEQLPYATPGSSISSSAIYAKIEGKVATVLSTDGNNAEIGFGSSGGLSRGTIMEVRQANLFVGLLDTQTDRFHAARSFSRRRSTGFSWLCLTTSSIASRQTA